MMRKRKFSSTEMKAERTTPHIRESMPSMLGKDTWKAVDDTNLEWPFPLIPDEHLNLLPGLDCTVGLSSRAKYATQLGLVTQLIGYMILA